MVQASPTNVLIGDLDLCKQGMLHPTCTCACLLLLEHHSCLLQILLCPAEHVYMQALNASNA